VVNDWTVFVVLVHILFVVLFHVHCITLRWLYVN
jgi:hypothetical protein